MDFYQITEHFAGGQNVVHPVMGHGPAVADIGGVKISRFAAALINPDSNFLRQGIQVITAGMGTAEYIRHQDLGIFQIILIPACPAAQRVELNPIIAYLFTFLCSVCHKITPAIEAPTYF
jgi:hypothetical protein